MRPQKGTNEIVQQLRAERARLDAAIQALEGVGGGGSANVGVVLQEAVSNQPPRLKPNVA